MCDTLDRCQEVIRNVKKYIFNRRELHAKYVSIHENLGEREWLININFRENYSNRNQ